MAKYNFYISYSHQDTALARPIVALLQQRGYSVFIDTEMPVGVDWETFLAETIAESDCVIPLITDAFLLSAGVYWEMQMLLDISRGRAKKIIPFFFTHQPLPDSLLELARYQGVFIGQSSDIPAAIDRIDCQVGLDFKISTLYEKLTEYRSLKHAVKEAETLCHLIKLLCKKWNSQEQAARRRVSMELCRLLEQLMNHSCSYGTESKALCGEMMEAASAAAALLSHSSQDIFFLAFDVRLKYWDWHIRTEAVDLHTGGDVFQGIIDPYPIEKHIEAQKPYVQAFETALDREQDTLERDSRFSAEEIRFIRQTFSFVLSKNKHDVPHLIPRSRQTPSLSEEDGILQSVAKFMQQSNQLFDVLQKRGAAGDFLKCLLTSYERLMNYCQIVDATDVAADCVDRIVEIRDLLARQEYSPTTNEKAEDGIKTLLGLTLHRSGNYDVFISFKSEDADLAEKIYRLCQRHMKLPFWSKRTLPELSKSEYEDAIYDALRKSRHFVVVLSDLKYLEANWVQREMKAFDRAITEGRKPNGNFVFVVTDTVYKRIIDEKKMCLDERYCGYQILKMSEYEETLMQYIT